MSIFQFHLKRTHSFVVKIAAMVIIALITPQFASASVANWQQGANIRPADTIDYSSANFRASVDKLKATGADYATVIIPYYQNSQYGIDMGPGRDTPTDQSLKDAANYIHSKGMKVMFTIHLEAYDTNWRANINPDDRQGWFTNYGNMLVKYATIAQQTGVEQFCLGAELINMTSPGVNSTNTANWNTMIARVRQAYTGKLTYSSNGSGMGNWYDEKSNIAFWSKLDSVGMSVYYNLGSNDSVDALRSSWDTIRRIDIEPLYNRIQKPIVFTEIGYRSINGAVDRPWDYSYNSSIDQAEQANAYEALLSYWNDYQYVQGVHWWDWETTLNAGGSANSGYTPQNKQAEAVMTKWFTSPVNPTPTSTPSPTGVYSLKAVASPNPVVVFQNATVTATVKNAGPAVTNVLVDIEVYNAQNQKVHQQFFSGQNFASGETKNFSLNFLPNAAGIYSIRGGLFSSDWSVNYYWNNNAGSLTAQSNVPTPTPTPTVVPTPTLTPSITPTPTPTPKPTATPTPAPNPSNIEIWWPGNGVTVSGVQPFKAIVSNMSLSGYQMYWQVDGDSLNTMYNVDQDYPHKESMVDLSGWTWKGSGPYAITFVAKDLSGKIIAQKSINIYVTR